MAVALTPIWLTCLALHVGLVGSDRLVWWPVYSVAADTAADHPVFRSYWADYPHRSRELTSGDVLLAIGETDLRGAGRFDVLAAGLSEMEEAGSVDVRIRRAGEVQEKSVELLPHSAPWRTVPLTIGLGLSAIFALIRGRGQRSTRRFAVGAMTYSFVWLLQFGGPPWQTALGLVLLGLPGCLFLPFTLAAALDIPERIAPTRSTWAMLGLAAFTIPGLLNVSWMLDWPIDGNLAIRSVIGIYLPFTVTLFFILARNYRRANAKGRRQLKWVGLGFYIGLAPVLITSPLMVFDPETRWLYELSLVTTPVIPVCILIAILRDSFLDIDRILTSTLLYSLVVPVFVATLLAGGSRVASSLSDYAEISPSVALWLVGLFLATLAHPTIQFVRPFVVRMVSADAIRVQAGLRSLRNRLSARSGAASLLQQTGMELTALMELDRCAIYVQAGDAYVATFSHGSLVPPLFSGAGGLVRVLSSADEPADRAAWRTWAKRGALDVQEAAALETIGARVLVPIRRADSLFAFVAIGEKQSGDVFTKEECVLLEALGQTVGHELEQLEWGKIAEADTRFREELSDFIPAPVLAEIERGGDIELGDVEISIMFVDIRGYTTLSVERTAEEVFDITDDYTAVVSGVIGAYGGVVVEFQGDGLMAIFGALDKMTDKERAAVEAGRELFDITGTRSFGRLNPVSISVGVGVATGDVFVGSIHSAGQKIWSAMGSKVNFAARLEGLTRDLKASLVVDELTFDRAGEGIGFERYDGIPVKGYAEPVSVYAIPLPAEART